MNLMYNFVEVIASFLEAFLAFELFRGICVKINDNKYLKCDVICAFIGMMLIRIGNRISLFSYFTLFGCALYEAICLAIIYKKRIILTLSFISFYVLCLTAKDVAIISMISLMKNGEALYYPIVYEEGIERILFILISETVWAVTCLFVNWLFSKTKLRYNFKKESIFITLMGTIGMVFLINQTLSAFNIFMANMWLALIAFLLLIVFTLYFGMMDRENKLKLQMMEIRNDLLEDKYQSIHEIYSNNAKLYHDMNNHFQILYQFLEAKKLEDAKEYLSKISEPMVALSKKTWTGNEILDVVINNKIDEMKKKKIAYEVNAEPFAKCIITTHDLSMILYNLMDNAIESTAHIENERKIILTIRPVNQFLAVKVTNPCEKTFSFTGLYPKTTKKDKILHGWGLKSVSDIVKKYDGSMNCENKDGVFEVMILLPMNK